MKEQDELNLSDREFVERYIPFKTLKGVGFFNKSVKAKDYSTIIARVLHYFGQTKREFVLSQPTLHIELYPCVVTGSTRSYVNKEGELHQGEGFKLDVVS